MPKRLLQFAVSFLLSCLIIFGWQRPASADNQLEKGIADFSQGRYLNALAELLIAAHSTPSNATAHYYLANTLSYLSQPEGAQEEYKKAYLLSPAHSQMAQYCMQAIQGYEEQQQVQMNHQFIRQMVTQIREEVSSKKRIIDSSNQAYTFAAAQLANMQKAAIERKANNDVSALLALWGHRHSAQLNWQIQAISQQAESDAQIVMRRLEQKTISANKNNENLLVSVENSASSLEGQLLHPSIGGVRLNPLGTNLYVRNYSYDTSDMLPDSQSLPIPLMAKAKSLVLDQTNTNDKRGLQRSSEVHGEILNH